MNKRNLAAWKYPLARPSLGLLERRYLLEAYDSGWISSKGRFVDEFERRFASYQGLRFGISTTNGTAALHLALLAVGIKGNEEVIVPDLTFVSPANAVSYLGARPVFADSNRAYWGVDVSTVRGRLTRKTRAVIVVHLYGHPVDVKPIQELCEQKGLYLIEDCAEAHGALYRGKLVGSFGDVSCFSFYGNKILTTGEGGICVTNDGSIAKRIATLRDHAQDPVRHFWHTEIGYNYRMTNVQAAIGVGQLEGLDKRVSEYRRIAHLYADYLDCKAITLHPEMSWAKCVFWMYTILFNDLRENARDAIISRLAKRGIESRPTFYPVSMLPSFARDRVRNSVASSISKRGISLPTYIGLSETDIELISEEVLSIMKPFRTRAPMGRSALK